MLQFHINGFKTNSRSSNCLFTTHMQISSQFRKPSSHLKQTLQKYIRSIPYGPICCTSQSLLQHTCLRRFIHTQHVLSSDYLPIITTINIRHDYRLQQNRQIRLDTMYRRHRVRFRADHNALIVNGIYTNIIRMADKHNIPKDKIHINIMLLLDQIECKITQINNIRRANSCDPALKLPNEKITSGILKHKQNICNT